MKPIKVLFLLSLVAFSFFLAACAMTVPFLTTVPPTTTTTTTTTEITTTPTTSGSSTSSGTLTTTETTSSTNTTSTTTSTTTTGTTDTTTTTQSEEDLALEILSAAALRVIISNQDNIQTDFSLPSSVNEVNVTWTSNHPTILDISEQTMESPEGYDLFVASVNRPSDADITVILTGHFQWGVYTYEADYVLRVRLETGLTTYPTISTLHASAGLSDLVQVSGYVYSIYRFGYFLIDSSGVALGVFTTEENAALVSIGDEVVVKGTYSNYHSLFQVKDLTKQTILSKDNSTQISATVLEDPAAFLTLDYSNKALHGQLFTLTVTPKAIVSGANTNIYLFSGETRIAQVYYNSDEDSIAAIQSFLDLEITLNVLYYTYHETNTVIYVTFFGGMDDIIVAPLTDEQKLAQDVSSLNLALAASAGDTMNLPQTGLNGSAITWASGQPTLAPISGTDVLFDAEIMLETITLTATVTYGTLAPINKVFTITVTGDLDIATVNSMETGTIVSAKGKVYLVLQNGYFIQDSTGNLAVYTGGVPTVVLGDEIVVTGPLSMYGTLKQLFVPTATTVLQSGTRSVPTSTAWNPADEVVAGQLYRITGTIRKEGTNSNYYLYDGSTKIGVIYYKSPADALATLDPLVDSTVSLEAYYYTKNNDSNAGGLSTHFFAFDNCAGTLSDGEKAERDLMDVSIDPIGYLGRYVILPQEGFYGSQFLYSCVNVDAVSIYPVAALVYGVKVEFNGLATVTITATSSYGTDVVGKNFEVEIRELTLTSVANVYLQPDGTDVFVEGIVMAFNGSVGFFLQGLDGTGIYVDQWIDGIEIGNTIVIHAQVEIQTGIDHDFVYLGGETVRLIFNDYVQSSPALQLVEGTVLSALLSQTNLLGSYLRIEDLTVSKYEAGFIWFLLGNLEGTDIFLKVAYIDSNLPIAFPAGTVIPNAELVIFRPDGTDWLGINLLLPEWTDAQKLAMDLALLETEMSATNSLSLPVLTYATYSGILISTELQTNLLYSAGQFTVIRPAAGSSDVTGTLSFTLTVGAESSVHVITVTVEAESAVGFADLFISEYIEGSSFNKFIEIFNGTGVAVDLSAYTLTLYSNGNTTATATMTLAGTLNSGCVIVLYNSQATMTFTNPNGLSATNNGVINFNGDDVLVLKHDGVIIDSFGQFGMDPGDFWGTTTFSTKDFTLVRMPSITAGRLDPTTVFDPSAEWIVNPKDSTATLGSHTIG